jgi:CheY-like chemotaxis protein
MKGRADQQQLQLNLQRDFESPLVALLDRGKFGQVLINLLANAIKFTPPGGRVLLQATLEDGPALHAVVEDDGPGVSPAELAALFRPFQQGASGLQQGGTGLGLSLSRKIVEAMGGRLWLDSEPGHGTRAHLLLPLQRSAAALPAVAGDRFADGAWRLAPDSRCRVLVVEDDRDSRDVLAGYLRQLGCEIGVAADGVQALALARERDFDIVLTDMRMPELDGPGLREALAAIDRCAAWPVVAVTASSLLLQREHFLQQGFAEYVAKPYAFADILRTLQRLAGARFERRGDRGSPGRADAPSTTSDAAPPDVASPRQALAWAQEGRASELRAWLTSPAALPTALRAPVAAALARYDLQLVERLLQDHLIALEPR